MATEKAKELVRMGVARAVRLAPQSDIKAQVVPRGLVIGGGVAGMSAALSLGLQGIKVHLVERAEMLGGLLRNVDQVLPGELTSDEVLENLKERIEQDPNIAVHLSSVVTAVEGAIGRFRVEIHSASRAPSERTLEVGAIIVATGAKEFEPVGMYGYGKMRNVVTELQLEEILRTAGRLRGLKHVVFVNCVGARVEEREYCGRFCCMTSVKNALRIRELAPQVSVTVLERDVMACGTTWEKYYRDARESGVRFVRYDPGRPLKVVGDRRPESVQFSSAVSHRRMETPADMVVLTTPLVPQDDSKELSKMLKVPLGDEGFFLEAHVKLRPVEFSTDGIFICGSARYPANAVDSISQGYAAATKATALLSKKTVTVEPITGHPIEGECTGCGACVSVCPYGAIELETDSAGLLRAHVGEIKCKGCGCCVAACASGAMQQRNWGDCEVYPSVSTVQRAETRQEPKALVFACNWCSYAGADLAGVSRYQIPHNVRVVRVMCSSRVRPESVVRALTNGMDGVLILGCHPGECHYVNANLLTRRRMVVLMRLLELSGIDSRRVRLDWVSASEGKRYSEVVGKFVQDLKQLANGT
jgi:heterodisulfide reductase subunit A